MPCAVQERAPAPVLGLFGGGTRKVESIATQVERQVESQRTRKGTQVGARAPLRSAQCSTWHGFDAE
jgi:hypothetical protein